MTPSMKQAEWIAKQMESDGVTPDDIFDILTGQITRPVALIREAEFWALQYEDKLRRGNARADQN